jgi:hypothetical protein
VDCCVPSYVPGVWGLCVLREMLILTMWHLSGLLLGKGPRWSVSCAGASEEEGGTLQTLLLEEALTQSDRADIRFLFDDGEMHLSGHREVLIAASDVFEAMFESGMVEQQKGVVRVCGISVSSFRGFLERMYRGERGEECGNADGRELWVLAEMYNVEGVRKWLAGEGINRGNVCAAYEFGQMSVGVERGEILKGCVAFVRKAMCEVSLSCVSACDRLYSFLICG